MLFISGVGCYTLTVRLPLQVFGGDGLPTSLQCCPLCGMHGVDAVHILHACPSTWDLYVTYCSSVGIDASSGNRLPWSRLRLELFADRISFLSDESTAGSARIAYVGRSMQRVARLVAVDDYDIEDLLVSASQWPCKLRSAAFCQSRQGMEDYPSPWLSA